MANIFLSYAREDIERARSIASALESQGWSVFWDRHIPHGQDFNSYIQSQLDEARCIIVLWSKAAVASQFVRDEASEGLGGRLVPLLLEKVRPPLGFRQLQTADLTEWDGTASHEDFVRLIASIRAICPTAQSSTTETTRKAELGLPGSAQKKRSSEATDYDRGIQIRLTQALNNPKWPWRSLKQLAIEAAVSEEKAADLLRSDPRVRFGKNKSLGVIVALRARVGDTQTSATQQAELAAPPGKKSTIDMTPTLPDAARLINTGPGPNKRLIKRIMRGTEKLMAWEIIREELPKVFFVEFTVRNLEPDSCVTADYKVANSQWHQWYKLWNQQSGGFGGASGDGLDGTLPW
jgi:hypothetical protein